MALTNESASNIRDNVVLPTDVNANVPEPQGKRRPRQLSPEAAILLDKAIIAKPLVCPEIASIHVKDRSFYYRWVNALSNNGQRYMLHKSLGFVNATSEDVDILVGDTTGNDKEIRAGDVILMKLPYEKWAMHVKANMHRAIALASARGVYLRGERADEPPSMDVFSDEKVVRASVKSEPFNRGKVEAFIPDNVEELFERSETSKNAERIRKQSEDMRSKAAEARS